VQQGNLSLRAGTTLSLANHIAAQLDNIYPAEGRNTDTEQVMTVLPRALERLRPIVASVRNFDPGHFNHFHSLQYATLLYLLSNEQWGMDPKSQLAERLYCLNRALSSLDLFYAIRMPEVFFISHGLGTVLGNATYGTRLVVFQNVTVGRVGTDRPVIGTNVVLFPGAVVTGRTVIGDNSVVAAGVVVHGIDIPPDTVATMEGGQLKLGSRKRDYAALYFRPDH
jgi:serine O-acetyltransferase